MCRRDEEIVRRQRVKRLVPGSLVFTFVAEQLHSIVQDLGQCNQRILTLLPCLFVYSRLYRLLLRMCSSSGLCRLGGIRLARRLVVDFDERFMLFALCSGL